MAEKGDEFILRKAPVGATVTFSNASNICNYTSHGMSAGDAIIFTGGTLPVALTASQPYYAGTILSGSFTMHLTKAAAVAGTGVVALAGDGSGTIKGKILTTVAGMRTTAFTIGGEEVDVTTKDSASSWRELLPAAGVGTFSMSASGVFQADAGLQQMRVDAITRVLETYGMQFESGDEYWGTFQVVSVEHAGEYNGEVTYSVTLESSGVITLITNA